MRIATQLAEWISQIQLNSIPNKVLIKAKKCIFDTIGVTIAGTQTDTGKVIKNYIKDFGGHGVCRVIGTSIKTTPSTAALANGAMGHALDFDDTSYSYIGHPSISILPAALAVGEVVNSSGAEVLLAYIIGTEVACKVGAMVTPKLFQDGWQSTAVIGAFGATAAAAKLLELKKDKIVHALAITASETSGIMGNNGTMSKPFQVGRSCENGVVATFLSHKGLTGAADIFEKTSGFCNSFKVSQEFRPFYSKMGKPFDIDKPGFFLKKYPCCSSIQAALDATQMTVLDYKIEPDQVESVDCAVTPLVFSCLPYSEPRNWIQAKFSMQFCIANAILNKGDVRVRDFVDEKVRAPDTIKMMKKIKLQISPELEKKGFAPFDGPESAIVEIVLKGNKRYKVRKNYPDWSPDNTPSWDALSNKYRECSSTLSRKSMECSIEKIRALESLKKIKELMDTLVC